MKRSGLIVLVVAISVGIYGFSQDGPPRGGFGPPPGARPDGGPPFGPMMTAAAQRIGMLRIPEVQSELRLDRDQLRAILENADEFDREMRVVLERIAPAPGNFDAPPPARDAVQREVQVVAERFFPTIEQMLKPEQQVRWQQLAWQQGMPNSLLDDSIVRKLKLSSDQIQNLEAYRDAPPFVPPEERTRMVQGALAELTPAQRETWNELVGAHFEFPAPPQRFGQGGGRRGEGPGGGGPMDMRGPGGQFGAGGPMGPGGPMGEKRELVAEFDENGDGWLNADERQKARAASPPRGRGGRGLPGMRGGASDQPAESGKRIHPEDVAPISGDLYDHSILRTLFLEFPNDDWEDELEAFNNTDVDIPATLIVDGETYAQVGVHFRGMSSYFAVPRGYKRSLNLSIDFIQSEQRLYGYKTLNLLNSHGDPTFMHTVLYSQIARHYIPAPQANFVRVVINGEDWGLYVNAQQFNKEFVAENYPTSKGARWKVPGSPNARAGLEYLGEDIDAYKQRYEIKSDDKEGSWRKLIDLCQTLNETPLDQLETVLPDKLDIEGVLWFLALDVALNNMDGYWVRASDYNLYMSPEGKFHVIPHDLNETFSVGMMGPGMRGGPGRGPENDERGARPPIGDQRGGGPPGIAGGRGGIELDPLVGLDDLTKPLRSRLLAVPAWREQYLRNMRTIAEQWLGWNQLEPIVASHARLIEPVLIEDRKKLSSLEDFYRSVAVEWTTGETRAQSVDRRGVGLKAFADQRREYLLSHPSISELAR